MRFRLRAACLYLCSGRRYVSIARYAVPTLAARLVLGAKCGTFARRRALSTYFVLCFDDVMRSRHDVMFRFADVVLCFDVVRPEMDVTQETQRGIFRGASRCCCSFASLSFLSCKNQPARTQSKRSDFKRRSSSSCVHLAFEWLLFTRNWCWQAAHNRANSDKHKQS